MSEIRYWECSGELRKNLLATYAEMKTAKAAIFKFAKRFGCIKVGMSQGVHFNFALQFKTPPDPAIWKEMRYHKGNWLPRLSSKEGKALDKEMQQLSRAMPSGLDLATAIGMDWFGDGCWRTPGMRIRGKRVFISAPADYSPPPKLKGQMKRISDVTFEKLAS